MIVIRYPECNIKFGQISGRSLEDVQPEMTVTISICDYPSSFTSGISGHFRTKQTKIQLKLNSQMIICLN